MPPDLLESHFRSGDDGYRFVSPVKRRVEFREHNLLAEPVIMPQSDRGGRVGTSSAIRPGSEAGE